MREPGMPRMSLVCRTAPRSARKTASTATEMSSSVSRRELGPRAAAAMSVRTMREAGAGCGRPASSGAAAPPSSGGLGASAMTGEPRRADGGVQGAPWATAEKDRSRSANAPPQYCSRRERRKARDAQRLPRERGRGARALSPETAKQTNGIRSIDAVSPPCRDATATEDARPSSRPQTAPRASACGNWPGAQ